MFSPLPFLAILHLPGTCPDVNMVDTPVIYTGEPDVGRAWKRLRLWLVGVRGQGPDWLLQKVGPWLHSSLRPTLDPILDQGVRRI